MKNTYVAVDVGGTQIRVAVYPEEGLQALRSTKTTTVGEGSVIDRIKHTIKSIWDDSENVIAIALCVPGPVDPKTGMVFGTANIPEWNYSVPVVEMMKEDFQTPIFIGNDANLAGLAEWKFGAGRGHDNMLYFTISTGVGGGIISDGKLIVGNKGLGGELGHVFLMVEGENIPPCGCGQKGHLESFTSGTGIAWYVNHQLESGRKSSLAGKGNVTARDTAIAAKEGDGLALEAFNRAGYYLAHGIANYLHIFSPTMIVFGGGVSSAGDILFGPMEKTLPTLVYAPAYYENLQIAMAELGGDVGLLGCLALARISVE
ncbi:MAG: ROK family protein [Anaerolineaceae bacterium]|nr:ROK family protein [Anaerolineaceae bacterium]